MGDILNETTGTSTASLSEKERIPLTETLKIPAFKARIDQRVVNKHKVHDDDEARRGLRDLIEAGENFFRRIR